jgi:hypothetical protein
MNLAQNLSSAFGKMFRIDPLGKNSRNGKYGVPAANPFVKTADALPEIFAYGIRNMQRFGWDPKNGAMFMSDIGQNIVEEVSPISAGANLGWNIWEGSYRFISRQAVSTESPRSDPKMTYPIVEWDQLDPIMLPSNSSSSVGVIVYRSTRVPQLTNRLLFGDMPAGELFHVSADNLPNGGQDAIRRVLFVTAPGTAPRKLLEIIQEKNKAVARSDEKTWQRKRRDPEKIRRRKPRGRTVVERQISTAEGPEAPLVQASLAVTDRERRGGRSGSAGKPVASGMHAIAIRP